MYSHFGGTDSPRNGGYPKGGDLLQDGDFQGMMTVPGFLIVLEMGIVSCPMEGNRPRDCDCPRDGDNFSCDDHSRGGDI